MSKYSKYTNVLTRVLLSLLIIAVVVAFSWSILTLFGVGKSVKTASDTSTKSATSQNSNKKTASNNSTANSSNPTKITTLAPATTTPSASSSATKPVAVKHTTTTYTVTSPDVSTSVQTSDGTSWSSASAGVNPDGTSYAYTN